MSKLKVLTLSLLMGLLVVTPALAKNDDGNSNSGSNHSRLSELLQRLHNFRLDLRDFRNDRRDNKDKKDDKKNTETCYEFDRNLGVGASGSEVVKLHAALEKAGFPLDNSNHNNLYNEDTAATVVRFQAKYGIAQTGYVGPLTRAELNKIFADQNCDDNGNGGNGGSNTNRVPLIKEVSGPTTIDKDESGTWTVRASDPQNGSLRYSVRWGDENNARALEASAPSSLAKIQTATFTHTYASEGNYQATFTVTDDQGYSASRSLLIRVGNASSDSRQVTVKMPNGGERWLAGSAETIGWGLSNNASGESVDLYLYSENNGGRYVLDRDISGTRYNWIVATDINDRRIPAGQYRVQICLEGSNTCDTSNSAFTIYDKNNGNRPPTLNGVSGPTVLGLNKVGTWSVRATDPEGGELRYSVDWGDTKKLETRLLTLSSASAIQTSTFTHSYAQRGTYTVRFQVTDSSGAVADSSMTVQIN
jgi:peptidoglycan hydrolase-like protein with peptidoglycan-binding domain